MEFTYEGLWKILAEKQVTIEEIAEKVGVEVPELTKLKNGSAASRQLVESLCKYFSCKAQDLMDKIAIRITVKVEDLLNEEEQLRFSAECRRKLHFARNYEGVLYDLAAVQEDKKIITLTGYFYSEDITEIGEIIRRSFKLVKSDADADALEIVFENCSIPAEPAQTEPVRTASAEVLARIEQSRSERAARTAPVTTPTTDAPTDPVAPIKNAGRTFEGTSEAVEEGRLSKVDLLKKEIDALVGAQEFRNLCKEIIAVSSQFATSEAKKIFFSQTYLFSISGGEGLTTTLELLGKVVSDAGIMPLSDREMRETKVEYESKTEAIQASLDSSFSRAFPNVSRSRQESDCFMVTCLDISDWIDHIGNSYFKDFLRKIATLPANYLVVFRIPFVDKEVLNKVREALNDALYVRTVSFPPLSSEAYRKLTKASLAKFGYKMNGAAWPMIEKRLNEEKSDGTFYGIKTLNKVLFELLYKKAVTNATRSKPSFTINPSDARQLVQNSAEDMMNADELLSSLVGMEDVKKQLNEILTQIEFARTNSDMSTPSIHMRFVGNPGTGKTTVARILGKILKERGILRIGNFFEYTGRDFCGRYIGETSPKTQMMCRDAYGSVLFIDEAYSLYKGARDTQDYGKEALDTLISEMENHRDDLLVIMAGYPDEMENLMSGNSGLRSRMPYVVTFKNFTREELYGIFEALVKKSFKYNDDLLTTAKEYFMGLEDRMLESKEFSNGRFVRNIFERTWAKAAMRRDLDHGVLRLSKEDFLLSVSDENFKKDIGDSRRTKRIGFGDRA